MREGESGRSEVRVGESGGSEVRVGGLLGSEVRVGGVDGLVFGPEISCSKNRTTEIILPSLKETEDTTGDGGITGTEPHPKLSPGCSTVAAETENGAAPVVTVSVLLERGWEGRELETFLTDRDQLDPLEESEDNSPGDLDLVLDLW